MQSPSPDPAALLRSRRYVGLLILAAILGVPISAAAYGFLALVSGLQEWLFTDLPGALGFDGAPLWWPLPLLALAGVLVGLTIRYLPGRGGHSPADGFKAGGVPSPIEAPGIALAALATLSLGAVLGPEAPLIALGAGLAGSAMRLARRDAPAQATAVVAGARASTRSVRKARDPAECHPDRMMPEQRPDATVHSVVRGGPPTGRPRSRGGIGT
jgi:H+/Cl- antiporter ClcA